MVPLGVMSVEGAGAAGAAGAVGAAGAPGATGAAGAAGSAGAGSGALLQANAIKATIVMALIKIVSFQFSILTETLTLPFLLSYWGNLCAILGRSYNRNGKSSQPSAALLCGVFK